MDRITVKGSTSYDVIIEHGILGRVGKLLRDEIAGSKALVVTDSNVSALYLNTAAGSIEASGYDTSAIVLEPGDQTKSIDNYVKLLSVLAEKSFSGTDVIVALGGGMIGDLVGFVGSTYKRGMRVVQIPTSLLAAVDSSVGGKTAINLPSGKNQVGTFFNPSIVVCDPDTMSTLSDNALHEGYAEIIKYGILSGETILDSLRKARVDGDYADVIRRSVTIKRDVVQMDEKDRNLRQYLNLGHLIGHAIEASSGYTISHGQAVAEGLALEARCAALSGFIEMPSYLAITALLEEFDFDILNSYSWEDLQPYLISDKRIRDDAIDLILPYKVGQCYMRSLPLSQLNDYINKGL